MRLAERHGSDVALGGTHASLALPLGFGVKIASWIDELVRQAARIDGARPRLLVIQMFGAVGTMAAFGDHGFAVVNGCAARSAWVSPSAAGT